MYRTISTHINRYGLHKILAHMKFQTPKCIAKSTRTFCSEKSYKAAILEEFNKKLRIENITNKCKLSQGTIRIGVEYCSLNVNDVKYMENKSDDILLPIIPGSEFSGEVLEVGDNCKQSFKIGEKITALLSYKFLGGGLAQEVIVNEDECFDIGSVSLKNAAVLAQGHGTALLAFTKYCELQENDNIVVIAGPGGNGLAAIQLASSVFKAKVYAICDTKDTSALLRKEGAYKSISINEGLSNVYQFVNKSLKEKKIKVVYDAVGSNLFYFITRFTDLDTQFLTSDPFYTPDSKKIVESITDLKKTFKKEKISDVGDDDEKDVLDSANNFISRIQYVDISEFRMKNLDLYRQVVQDTFVLCEEEIIAPYISRTFNLDDVNDAVKFIKEKKCTGKVLIDVKSRQDGYESD